MNAPLQKLDRPVRDPDQRVRLHGVSWKDYQAILRIRGEASVPRIAYLEGELELMTPSRSHERIKSTLGRLLELWALEMDVDVEAVGSWTLGNRKRGAGAEADESYVIGPEPEKATVPDLAIEVAWTSWSVDKLEIYRALRVREVWIWRDGEITVHALRKRGYVVIPRSEVLPSLDLVLLARYGAVTPQTQAVRGFRAALRKKRRPTS